MKERLAGTKHRSYRFHMEMLHLNEVEGKEKYGAEMSNRFVALQDKNAEVEINGA
jgi:hypothetical protein